MAGFKYYLGDSAGKVFEFGSSYTADDTGNAIITQYISKQLDFLDQIPVALDKNMTCMGVKLTYIDLGVVTVVVSISTDGGTSWTSKSQSVGTAGAPGTTATKDYHFVKTGQFFNVKIYHTGTTGSLQWVQLELDLRDSGEHFDLS